MDAISHIPMFATPLPNGRVSSGTPGSAAGAIAVTPAGPIGAAIAVASSLMPNDYANCGDCEGAVLLPGDEEEGLQILEATANVIAKRKYGFFSISKKLSLNRASPKIYACATVSIGHRIWRYV